MSLEIIIKAGIVSANATKMEKIAQKVAASEMKCTMNHSKGDAADSINALIIGLNGAGAALSKMFMENAENVRQIAVQFEAADSKLASSMKG